LSEGGGKNPPWARKKTQKGGPNEDHWYARIDKILTRGKGHPRYLTAPLDHPRKTDIRERKSQKRDKPIRLIELDGTRKGEKST